MTRNPDQTATSAAATDPREGGPNLPTPEHVVMHALKGLSPSMRRLLRGAYTIFAWITLPAAFISAIADVKIVIDGAVGLYRALPTLAPYFSLLAKGISSVVSGWRELTSPIVDLISWLLPIDLPQVAFDILVLAAIPTTRVLIAVAHRHRHNQHLANRAERTWNSEDPEVVELRDKARVLVSELPEESKVHAEKALPAIDALMKAAFKRGSLRGGKLPWRRVWLLPTVAAALSIIGLGVIYIDYCVRIGWIR